MRKQSNMIMPAGYRAFSEKIVSETAEHSIKFEYCGGWGYGRRVDEAIDRINRTKGVGKFNYFAYADRGRTGRLEVTLFKNQKDDTGSNGLLIHSKAASNQWISADW